MTFSKKIFSIILLTLLMQIELSGQNKVPAFPGADGFGKYTKGGRGGEICIVTNINDNGPGSLRDAIEKNKPRTIVFAVAGTISLESPLFINHGNLTIAGQSAPGEGITVKNYPIKINADNVIIRYIRSRMGDEKKQQDDALSAIRNKDIIIDHCSFSWGTDESASCYDNENFTMQWCIISESLNNSVHVKGEHGYGGIWGGKGATFHHNILAHHKSRNPRFNGARTQPSVKEVVDFRNNVVYNWRSNSAYAGENGNYNMVGNYYKPGPATKKNARNRFINPWSPYGQFFLKNNIMEGNERVTSNNYMGLHADHPDSAISENPIPVVEIKEHSAREAFQLVLQYAGASKNRDTIDERIVKEVAEGTAKYGEQQDGIIDTQEEVGGWPELEKGMACQDNDKDGMADEWEKQQGLDPNNPKDHSHYTLDKNYTNVEVYLNQLIETVENE